MDSKDAKKAAEQIAKSLQEPAQRPEPGERLGKVEAAVKELREQRKLTDTQRKRRANL